MNCERLKLLVGLLPALILATLNTYGDTFEAAPVLAADTCIVSDTLCLAEDTLTDSIAPAKDRGNSWGWISQLVANGFHINDPGVDYPKFPRFCLNVYNWGDRVFNSYDPEYVISAGKNWKAQLKTHNWMETYSFIFPHNQILHISSSMYADVGAYCSFMAVSVGYMFNANELAHSSNARSFFGLNFTCALFSADYSHTMTEGGAHITRFGKFLNDKRVHVPVKNLVSHSNSAKVVYYFNHRKYSQAAAECYSKYQLKSAGSWTVGFNYVRQDVEMDLGATLPEIWEELPELERYYHFNYIDYLAVGGYAYNWVLKPKAWLLNVSPSLGMGYKHTRESSTDGRRDMIATNGYIALNLVYNHRALFAGVHAKASASWYFNGNYTFMNTFYNLQASVGIRF